MVRRFIAGETLESAGDAVLELNAQGFTATLDYLGENVTNEAEAQTSADNCMTLQDYIRSRSLDANVSVKLTQLGLDISTPLAVKHMESIVEHAAQLGQFVRIDMESSAHTDRTLAVHRHLWSRYRNVGIVLQSYLLRTDADLEQAIRDGIRVRLVKGAYDEPATVAYRSKRDVDAAFLKQTKRLLDAGDYPAIATHDERLIRATQVYAESKGIARTRYEFQMLYGIRRDLQAALVKERHYVRIYTPYGHQWYGYMMRRLAERPANLWFVLKNLMRR
jgi:proline dehydrogenase